MAQRTKDQIGEKLEGVMKRQCATCPFRERGGLPVRELLEKRALTDATPICHSTGNSAIVPKEKRVSRKPLACRGARDLQLNFFAAIGFIEAPTDAAWNKKAQELKVYGPAKRQKLSSRRRAVQ